MFDDNGSFILALFEFFIFFAYLMCLFWIFGDLFRSRDLGGGAKTLWLLFIIILPGLGMLIYVIARGGGMTQRAMEHEKQLREQQAAYVQSVAGSQGGGAADQRTVGSAVIWCGNPALSPSLAVARILLERWNPRPRSSTCPPVKGPGGSRFCISKPPARTSARRGGSVPARSTQPLTGPRR